MKVYSWNMYDRNRDLDRAFSFIEKNEFDVFCLQEVPQVFLDRLQTLPYMIAYDVDRDRMDGKTPKVLERAYCVILTPHTIVRSSGFPLPRISTKLRTKLTVFLLRPLGWTLISNRRSVWADIEFPKLGRMRVFSLHLTLAWPEQRLREYRAALEFRNRSEPTLVCGDFNILETMRVAPLNWLLGGRLRDIGAWRSERREFEQAFSHSSLQNPFRGMRTQTLSRSQLDHILIPKSMRITRVHVLPDRVGSDHHPIFVETA